MTTVLVTNQTWQHSVAIILQIRKPTVLYIIAVIEKHMLHVMHGAHIQTGCYMDCGLKSLLRWSLWSILVLAHSAVQAQAASVQQLSPVLLSRSCTCSSADVMVLPKGKGNSRSPHFLPLLKAAVSSSSPRMSRGNGRPLGSRVNGFISKSVKSRSRNTCLPDSTQA